ncbi:MAG: hypothetical protein R3Y39_05450 [Rikenellaceae bacterium]
MKQQNSRMVVEVNKLIANALLSEGGVYLPNVGSLSITTSTPENGDPTRDITLLQGEQYRSLTTIISSRGNCSPSQAEQVYKRWLDVVTEGDTITILGIGEITANSFTITSQMFNKLNPVQALKSQGATAAPKEQPKVEESAPTPIPAPTPTPAPAEKKESAKVAASPKVETKTTKSKGKSKGGYVWALAAAIALIVGVTYYALTYESGETNTTTTVVEQEVEPIETEAEPTPEPTPEPEPKQVATKSINLDDDPAKVLEQVLEQSKSSTAKYRVVFAVFSSPSNGGRTIIEMAKGELTKDLKVSVYPYGSTYMLTIFESNSEEECHEFKRSALGKSISEDLWVYAKR